MGGDDKSVGIVLGAWVEATVAGDQIEAGGVGAGVNLAGGKVGYGVGLYAVDDETAGLGAGGNKQGVALVDAMERSKNSGIVQPLIMAGEDGRADFSWQRSGGKPGNFGGRVGNDLEAVRA